MTAKEMPPKSDGGLPADPKPDPLSGVVDPRFRYLMEEVRANIVPYPYREGFYDLEGTIAHVSSVLYPLGHNVSPGEMLSRQRSNLGIIKREGLLETERVEVKGKNGVTIADEQNILLAASYLYVRVVADIGGDGTMTVRRLRRMAELWGKNPMAAKIRDSIDKVTTEGFESANRNRQSRAVIEDQAPKFPPENPEYRKLDRKVLERLSIVCKKKFPRWNISGNEIYAASHEIGLPFEVIKAIEFVRNFKNWTSFNILPKEDRFLITEFIGCVDYCVTQIKLAEEYFKKSHASDVRIPRYTLYGLVESRKKMLNESTSSQLSS